ncbi:formate dehydrogenase-N subunit alpha [Dechloromonas denitrificans]|uniref:formate dehydrogenase-N subunit alpha n=1 Tax=Dechloromonas denitrificans TaxID=281362 RepID=UPI001CF825F8|nr:formate dehydrogenase-N subunit alpha [Dechloromonas denitrificans]UCV05818.1 formate dehydrogenase-N subunit alpha [Dechloromonas denitrificans]UCV10068.1 formate dehydrogenase-N subunit alpha [Dechloromonas denitrificans]
MKISRRQFFKISAAGLGTSSLAVMGIAPTAAQAEVRQYKLARAREIRNICTYCSVGCGLLMYSLGSGSKNAKAEIIHIEGDPDHPVSRGALCPKGSGLLDFIHSPNRLKFPEVREAGSTEWKRIDWHEAIQRIAKHMKADRDANIVAKNADGVPVNRWPTTGMLTCSAASNETGILTQKIIRSLGIVATDTQARICHAPTVTALASSFGRGAMTNSWVDIRNADFVLVMGGNAAEAHPVGFRWTIEAMKQRGAKLAVVDPRFNRTAAVADHYVPIRSGSDIAFLGGVINWLIANDKIQWEYVKAYTNASAIIGEGYGFEDGLFSGFDKEKGRYDRTSWNYELDAKGNIKTDPTLEHPRCVWNLLKAHYARYTPDVVTNLTGSPKEGFLKVCELLGETSAPNKVGTVLYALGWTEHTVGAQNIRTMAMIQLLLGNIGMPGGGVNALRGHANVQGLSDLGLLSTALPGYIPLPNETNHPTFNDYVTKVTPKALRENQLNFWSNTPKFFVSLLKWFWGDKATKENNWGYDWLPKWDKLYDTLYVTEQMQQGKMNGLIVQGFNPIGSFPDANRVIEAFSKLKYLVVIDPIATETASFWQNHGESNNVDSSKIQTEVFRLPSTCFAEEDGSTVSSARWMQWHFKGAEAPGEAKADPEILAELFITLRDMYQKDGGNVAEPILNLSWPYKDPLSPDPTELAKEMNGRALADLLDPKDPTKVLVKKGEQLPNFAVLRDDGSTLCATWIYAGSWTQAGNMMARRDNTDSGLGNTPNWAFAWPANRRILYNRASCDPSGKPWDPKRKLIGWNGERWGGSDVPDFKADAAPDSGMDPFIMTPEGLGRLFSVDKMTDGPFPEHYEPMESPLGTNPLHPNQITSPAVRIFKGDKERLGTHKEFPYVGTTYRLTEHFQFWTKQVRLNAIAQPEQFVEINEGLAKEKGIQQGDMVKVSSKRGFIKAKAVVTKRIKALTVNQQTVHHIGIPVHWGWESVAKKGFLTNVLTPAVGECNTQCPEFKAFLVNIEKV